MTHVPASARRLRRVLAPLTIGALTALTACGGGESTASSDPSATPSAVSADAAPRRMTIQAASPSSFRHPGIYLTQARLDAFKAATNATNDSVIKILSLIHI